MKSQTSAAQSAKPTSEGLPHHYFKDAPTISSLAPGATISIPTLTSLVSSDTPSARDVSAGTTVQNADIPARSKFGPTLRKPSDEKHQSGNGHSGINTRGVNNRKSSVKSSSFGPTKAPGSAELTPYAVMKRVIDFCGALSIFVLVAPIMVIVAIAVKVTSPGPIVYRQRRLTKGGKIFTIYKFRTMTAQAERHSGPVFAAANDPRVTPLGKFLRKTRLDELPQLVNVLSGDMSLVGPRPERPELAETLQSSIRRFDHRLRAKAGLTGLAQVAQGYPDGVDGYRRKLALDLLYIRKQSVLLDLWIGVRTIGVVLTGSGAR